MVTKCGDFRAWHQNLSDKKWRAFVTIKIKNFGTLEYALVYRCVCVSLLLLGRDQPIWEITVQWFNSFEWS